MPNPWAPNASILLRRGANVVHSCAMVGAGGGGDWSAVDDAAAGLRVNFLDGLGAAGGRRCHVRDNLQSCAGADARGFLQFHRHHHHQRHYHLHHHTLAQPYQLTLVIYSFISP